MKEILKYLTVLVLCCGMWPACQDIEDTYKEYAGNGPIQYLNKIYDLKTTPQWESVLLTWKLTLDPSRTGILVEWKNSTKTYSQMIDKDSVNFLVQGLTDNYDYMFNVWAVRVENGEVVKKSLGDAVYGRPFNSASDELALFTHVVRKQIKVANRKMFVIFDTWAANLISFKIGYFEKGNEQEQFYVANASDKINGWPKGKPYAAIGENIDFSKPVNVYRTGQIGSFGNKTLDLNPLELYFDLPTFNSDFANELRPQIGVYGEIKSSDVADISTLDINFNQTSLEDILYLPNLKTLNLGKGRYLKSGTEATAKSTLSSDVNRDISLGALELAYQLQGVQVNQYSKHYFDQLPAWFAGKNLVSQLPSLNLLNTSDWEITESPADVMGYETGLNNLLVDNAAQYWFPTASAQLRTHAFTIDMKSMKNVLGFKIVQPDINDAALTLSGLISIEILDASNIWVPAVFNQTVTIGNAKGEASLVYLDKDKNTVKQTQKIRVTVSDNFYKKAYDSNSNFVSFYRTALASFMVITK